MDGQWIQIITIIGANVVIFLTVVGLMIGLHFHTDNKISAIQAEMKDFNIKYMQETKDFHGRLVAIEERNKPKLL